MHLIPRKRATPTGLGEVAGKLSVNAMGFAGMLLTKDEEELEVVRGEGVGSILRDVGLERVHDVQVAGTALEAVDGDVAGVTSKI